MEDSLIIDLYFERSEQAIAETQSKYGRLCTKIATGILKRYEDAEEAVSTSYVKLWNAIPPRRPESLCGYLCRIVRNTALNHYDSLKRRSCEELYGELAEVLPDSAAVEDTADCREITRLLNDFLHSSEEPRYLHGAVLLQHVGKGYRGGHGHDRNGGQDPAFPYPRRPAGLSCEA